MTRTISNGDDIIDSRDIIERIEEPQAEKDAEIEDLENKIDALETSFAQWTISKTNRRWQRSRVTPSRKRKEHDMKHAKPTPVPWSISPKPGSENVVCITKVWDEHGKRQEETIAEVLPTFDGTHNADAELILAAVNHHAELVKALCLAFDELCSMNASQVIIDRIDKVLCKVS